MRGSRVTYNSQMKAKHLREFCHMDDPTRDLLIESIAQFSLPGRSYDRMLKLSRTIADLDDSDLVQPHHAAEAINYRLFDRKLFG